MADWIQYQYALCIEGESDIDSIKESDWLDERPTNFKTTQRDKFGRMPVQTIWQRQRKVSDWEGITPVETVGGDYLDPEMEK